MLKKLRAKIKKFYSIIKDKNKKFFDSQKVNDVLDLVKFVVIHGSMGLFILLGIVSMGNIGFSITTLIRNSYLWTILVFFIGSGSLYYIFIDIVSLLKKGNNKR